MDGPRFGLKYLSAVDENLRLRDEIEQLRAIISMYREQAEDLRVNISRLERRLRETQGLPGQGKEANPGEQAPYGALEYEDWKRGQ